MALKKLEVRYATKRTKDYKLFDGEGPMMKDCLLGALLPGSLWAGSCLAAFGGKPAKARSRQLAINSSTLRPTASRR
jgi:hypothetical protein